MIKDSNNRIALVKLSLATLVLVTILVIVGLSLFKSQEEYLTYTDIEQSLFSNEVKELPPVTPTTWEVGQERYEEQVAEYGDLAVRFWANESPQTISFVKEFDVDSDGATEQVVGLCGLWGNHCPHEIIIIEGDKQVFSTTAGLAYKDIAEAEDSNGFYLLWDSEEMRANGLAQPLGHIKTRFTYKDGQFQPVSSEEVMY